MLYFIKRNGFNPRNWKRNAIKMSGLEPLVVQSGSSRPQCDTCEGVHRRGELKMVDKDLMTVKNGKAIAEWIWIWLK